AFLTRLHRSVIRLSIGAPVTESPSSYPAGYKFRRKILPSWTKYSEFAVICSRWYRQRVIEEMCL
ncbi:MAG: hypothetical protein ABIF19_02130, partial [Planctomycetota bacterium]